MTQFHKLPNLIPCQPKCKPSTESKLTYIHSTNIQYNISAHLLEYGANNVITCTHENLNAQECNSHMFFNFYIRRFADDFGGVCSTLWRGMACHAFMMHSRIE